MALFILNSDVTIGKFRFSGVHDVRIRRSLYSYNDTAVIKMPALCRIQQGRMQPDGSIKIISGTTTTGTTRAQFKTGDPVTISLGYDGQMKEEFRGFVKRMGLDMPLEVECEGYIRQMRQDVSLSGVLKVTSAKQLLEMAAGIRDVKGKILAKPLTDIKVICQDDIPMHNIQLTEANGQQVIDEIKKISLGTLAVFFLKPTVLWCGFTYTPYLGSTDPFATGIADYQLGYNCVKNNGLKERVATEPVQVILNTTMATGQVVQTKSEANYAKRKQKAVFNNVQDNGWMKKMANEKQYRMNYEGLEGNIQGFLQPFCLPGYKVNVFDSNYPDLKGAYMVESTDVLYGVRGAKRMVDIGPIVGFNPKPKN